MGHSTSKSEVLFELACKVIPGGVNSPVRSFKAVGGKPVYIKKAIGPYMFDEDQNKYIDYIASFGPLIFGHSNQKIIDGAFAAMKDGTTFGACHKNEVKLAQLISQTIPSMEMLEAVIPATFEVPVLDMLLQASMRIPKCKLKVNVSGFMFQT